MLLAEEIASNVNWSVIFSGIMALTGTLMWLDSRRKRTQEISPQPLDVRGMPLANGEIQRDLKAMNHRIVSLENWRNELIQKMDEDKTTIIDAGEERGRRIYVHVDEVRRELSDKIDGMSDRIIATLKNTGAI